MDEQKGRLIIFDKALNYVDKLMPLFPLYAHFEPEEVINNSTWSEEDKDEAFDLLPYIIQTLNKFDYTTENRDLYQLTEKGVNAKKAGGHFDYLKKIAEKEAADIERQRLSDEKLHAEVDIVKFQKGLGKRLAIWGFVVAILSIVASVLATVWTNHKDTQQSFYFDTVSLRRQLQNLEQRLQKQEYKRLSDTIPRN